MSVLEEYRNTISQWPLMSSIWPTIAILSTYLLFVKKVGPKMMENKKPYELRRLMMAYNFVQVFSSIYLVYISWDGLYVWSSMSTGLKYFFKETTYYKHYAWVYYIAKLTELFDTVFMVLRKKHNQVSFLHVYHHITITLFCWVYAVHVPGDHNLMTPYLNSVIHVIMYTYYLLAGLGPSIQKYLFWKKYITMLQLIQFVMGFTYFTVQLFVGPDYYRRAVIAQWFYAISFLVLFSNFYKKSYKKAIKLQK